MELHKGMYVRTRKGKIAKLVNGKQVFPSPNVYTYCWELDDKTLISMSTPKIAKHSYNIIDLIEVGDYVNGGFVVLKQNNYIMVSFSEYEEAQELHNKNIKSIVTKEQFEKMKYKVEE